MPHGARSWTIGAGAPASSVTALCDADCGQIHRKATRIPAVTVHKWRALSLQRLAHLSERRRSGRWHLFYASQGAFEEAVRIAAPDAEQWKGLSCADSPPVQPAD